MREKRLLVLLACLVVATIGFGITLPVLPFYAERLALRGRASAADVAMQVAVLTAVYPMVQLIFAPLWGRSSDRLGRKRLVVIGIGGAALAQIAFGLATTLPRLYAARVFGGIVTSAIFPAAAAYVADSTTERERVRGMAWLGTASSLGVVVGPALGGALARTRWTVLVPGGPFTVTGFAVPFFAAALLALIATITTVIWLPESEPVDAAVNVHALDRVRHPMSELLTFGPFLTLLSLAVAGQFGLALFESTFALYAKRMWSYGPAEVGRAFIVCGLVMSLAQTGVAAMLARRVGELRQVAAGFALVGISLALLPSAQSMSAMLMSVGALALGIAAISPNIAALISMHGGSRSGSSLGLQGAANSLGQVFGTLAGGALLGWQMEAPFRLAAITLLGVTLIVAWLSRRTAWAARQQHL